MGGGMDILSWLLWLVLSVLGVIWTVVWFLISGWVSTLLQIAILVIVIYSLKYGWQRAPHEIWKKSSAFGRFFWNWVRARDPNADRPAVETREVVRVVRGGFTTSSSKPTISCVIASASPDIGV